MSERVNERGCVGVCVRLRHCQRLCLCLPAASRGDYAEPGWIYLVDPPHGHCITALLT